MAVSQVEEKILGTLAKETGLANALLSASFYQVLGLSILLSRRLVKARKLRKLDTSRDTKSLQLYHHIIWLAREGLSITEVYILPYCQNGEQGPECRVMAAKLRASFYHVFCLFHNHPPVNQLPTRPPPKDTNTPPSKTHLPKADNNRTRETTGRSPTNEGKRRKGKSALRDPIPSMTSDTSYVTNPYAVGPAQTPPPTGPPPPIPSESRRTPTRPPGLTPVNISPSQAAASFLLPPLNFVPLAREHFTTAQHLADTLLSPAHALRLALTLEHTTFLTTCQKDLPHARHLAKTTIKRIYASPDALSDDEFADAAALVQNLGAIVSKTPSSRETLSSPLKTQKPQIDRTIPISPPPTTTTSKPRTPRRTPDRLSTVPEVDSTSSEPRARTTTTAGTSLSPPISRLSSKTSRLRAEEQGSRRASPSQASRQATPMEGVMTETPATSVSALGDGRDRGEEPGEKEVLDKERREAVWMALEILTAVGRGLDVSGSARRGDGRRG